MRWPAEFVSLLLHFANRVTEVGNLDITEALLGWTPLYLNFGLPRTFDAADPTWQRFLAGYQDAADPVEWTHSFYLSRAIDYPQSPFGCFSYQYEQGQGSIRFHFGNHDTSGHGPLSERQRPERLQELRALFTDVR